MSRRLNPLEPGLDLEERQARIAGYVLHLERDVDGQGWDEVITVTRIRSYDETSGILALFAITGHPPKNFDPYRESGQMRTIHIDEIVKSKPNRRPQMSTATKTKKSAPKAKAAKTPKAATAPKGNRHEKREKALALRKQGKTYKEIQIAVGFANAGAACNAVKRAQAAEEAK